MPGPSELARADAEVQQTAPQAAALALAIQAIRHNRSLPLSLIRALLDDGVDINGLIRSIKPIR